MARGARTKGLVVESLWGPVASLFCPIKEAGPVLFRKGLAERITEEQYIVFGQLVGVLAQEQFGPLEAKTTRQNLEPPLLRGLVEEAALHNEGFLQVIRRVVFRGDMPPCLQAGVEGLP